jgi:hypothetical protein
LSPTLFGIYINKLEDCLEKAGCVGPTLTGIVIKLLGDGKAYYGLENNCKSADLWSWDKKKLLFETLVTPIILYGCEVWGCSISRESWRKIEQIQKNFITYNLKIKGNMPYPILLLETSLSPIESTTMTRYLMYKNKLNNMEDKRLPKISSKSSRNHHRLKRGWHKDAGLG